MRVLYLDCSSGVSGDMVAAALYGVVDDKESFRKEVSDLGIPGVEVSFGKVSKCGIQCDSVSVSVVGEEEHQGPSGHHHCHRSMEDVLSLIEGMHVSAKVKKRLREVYSALAAAESEAHGVPVSEIHFHEVGAKDAIADIALSCLLLERIGADSVVASPVRLGYGTVRCAHGVLSVPAPATEALVRGIPCYVGDEEGEFCTPTGAALLRTLVDDFSRMPVMTIVSSGRGAGKAERRTPNYLRAFVGETPSGSDEVCEIECNIDDMTSEDLAFAVEKLMECGALDAFVIPATMKKGRPGHILVCTCHRKDFDGMVSTIFANTSTAGVRAAVKERLVLDRRFEEREVEGREVRIKIYEGFGVRREKPEFEDLKRISEETGVPVADLRRRLSR